MLHRFHEDLERIGLRPRRLHDLRRTFISLCREDGANKELLRWVTHGVTSDVMDTYTTPTWEALCSQVSVLKLDLRRGEVIALPKAAAGGGGGPGGGGDGGDHTGSDDEPVAVTTLLPAAVVKGCEGSERPASATRHAAPSAILRADDPREAAIGVLVGNFQVPSAPPTK
jgi:hypothetical protein